MDIIKHRNIVPLIALIDTISSGPQGLWIVASIRRENLQPITNEAFLMTIRPVMQNAETVHVFFSESKSIHIAWKGDLQGTYKQLRSIVMSTLVKPGSLGATITYDDPYMHAGAMKKSLQDEAKTLGVPLPDDKKVKEHGPTTEDPFGWNDDKEAQNNGSDAGSDSLPVTPELIQLFQGLREQKRTRRHIEILIVEDHAFYRRLLCEIIRGIRVPGVESLATDIADGLKAAWSLFLKKDHDIIFVDLGLVDGSGHALSRAIKELDPSACVIIVTANNYAEEVGVAQQNNVDGFITKPYSKKQILDCIEKYAQSAKDKNKLMSRKVNPHH